MHGERYIEGMPEVGYIEGTYGVGYIEGTYGVGYIEDAYGVGYIECVPEVDTSGCTCYWVHGGFSWCRAHRW